MNIQFTPAIKYTSLRHKIDYKIKQFPNNASEWEKNFRAETLFIIKNKIIVHFYGFLFIKTSSDKL